MLIPIANAIMYIPNEEAKNIINEILSDIIIQAEVVINENCNKTVIKF